MACSTCMKTRQLINSYLLQPLSIPALPVLPLITPTPTQAVNPAWPIRKQP